MGLLDAVLGQVLGGMAQGSRPMPRGGDMGGMGGMGGMSGAGMGGAGGAGMAAIVALALQLLQRNGGIDGVLGRMRDTGHASEADSWVGKGDNMPITPDVLSQIFGGEQVGRAARDMGVDPDEALGGLANVFPEVVNQITPQGRVESESNDLVARALEELQRNHR